MTLIKNRSFWLIQQHKKRITWLCGIWIKANKTQLQETCLQHLLELATTEAVPNYSEKYNKTVILTVICPVICAFHWTEWTGVTVLSRDRQKKI